jgi:hypothetical protein
MAHVPKAVVVQVAELSPSVALNSAPPSPVTEAGPVRRPPAWTTMVAGLGDALAEERPAPSAELASTSAALASTRTSPRRRVAARDDGSEDIYLLSSDRFDGVALAARIRQALGRAAT